MSEGEPVLLVFEVLACYPIGLFFDRDGSSALIQSI